MANIVTSDEFLKALHNGIEGFRVTNDHLHTTYELADGRVMAPDQGRVLEDRGLIETEPSGPGNAQRLKIELTEAGHGYVRDLYHQQ